MIYPSNFENKIGFDVVRHEIAKRCISPMGVAWCEKMQFSSRHNEVKAWLTQVNEFVGIIESKREFPLNYFFDLRTPLRSIAAPGTWITAEHLYDLQRSLATIAGIIAFFRPDDEGRMSYPALAQLTAGMQAFPQISAEAQRVLDKFGNIKDNASPQLAQLRSTLNSTTASINGIMRRIIARGRQDGVLDSDTTPSVRDGRLVLPVSPMHKRKVHGIVHDESASGKTVFIEPEEIVEANNRIRETEAEIQREIVRILTAVTDLIRPHIEELLATYSTLGLIDFIRAKAAFALDIDAHMPHLQKIRPSSGTMPCIPPSSSSLKEQGKEVVPLNIELNKENRILIISGPNAGGKSVCLKTVGVVQYMMQCGVLPTLHDNSHMGIFKSIFIDIGDQQSIEDDLSTYSSHLHNMKTFLQRGDGNTMILIDEFGSGTEPHIGAAIAQAILEQLNHKQLYGVVTTHYQNLKHFAEETDGLVNGAMLYDRQLMKPLFQLSIGYPGSSFAIEIARKIGLPQQVIDKASEIVGSDYINMDKYLLDIVRDRRYWENKRYDVHQKEKRLDAIATTTTTASRNLPKSTKLIIKEAKTEAQEIISQSNAQVERTIKEIKRCRPKKKKRARCASISTSSSSGCSKPKKASMPRKCASCNPSAPCHSASSSHASPPTAKARKPTTTARWLWATTCSSRARPPWAP